MSQADLQSVQEALRALPKEEVKKPSIPIETAIQEAEDLLKWAEADREALTGVNLDPEYFAQLAVRAGACREAQSIWARDNKSLTDVEKQWDVEGPAGFKLRDKLLAAFRYAFRKRPDLQDKVAIIAEGNSRDDMIQDLNDCSVLGKANIPLLEAINFDLSLLDTAQAKADSLSDLLAGTKSGETASHESFDLRNRAYTYMKEAVDEVRLAGKYVFADNEERAKGYRSEYMHRFYLKKKRKGGEGDNPTPEE